MKYVNWFASAALMATALGSCSTQTLQGASSPQATFDSISTSSLSGTATPAQGGVYQSEPQGQSPFDFVFTRNGEYAFVGFDLSEVVLKIRSSDLSVVAEADLSGYFPIESEEIAINESETRLFVASPTWRKLIVLDTQTMSVIHEIDNIEIFHLFRSQYGPFLIAWNFGSTVYLINTETYEVTDFLDNPMSFMYISESQSDPNIWYVVDGLGPWPAGIRVGSYDHDLKQWRQSVDVPLQVNGEGFMDFKVLPDENKAYLATMGGWNLDYTAYGWLYSVDFAEGTFQTIPIDGAAMALESSPDGQRLFLGTGWPVQEDSNNLLVIDTQTNEIMDQVPMGLTKFRWSFEQMNRLQMDPGNEQFLFGTCTDANTLFKVDIDSLTLAQVKIFNQEEFRPHYFYKQPEQETGFILIHKSPYAFEFSLDQEAILGVVRLPDIRGDAYNYDIAINRAGRMLIAQGESILEVDSNTMGLLEKHPLPSDITGFWSFVLSRDQGSLFAIWSGPNGVYPPDTFLRIDTTSFQVEAKLKLEGGGFNSRPFELPQGGKLYALGGRQNGPVVVQVIDLETNSVARTITFDEPGLLGISAGPSYPFAYDPGSQTLFVGATQVVLAIDTVTDTVKNVIHLEEIGAALGLEPGGLTYINADGLVYIPRENYLYMAHSDRSIISIYDLGNNRFLPQVIPLKGYLPRFVFANDDLSRIYSLNIRSDSVSVIDVKTKSVEKVIDLHSYLPEP